MINDLKKALERDPSNPFLQGHVEVLEALSELAAQENNEPESKRDPRPTDCPHCGFGLSAEWPDGRRVCDDCDKEWWSDPDQEWSKVAEVRQATEVEIQLANKIELLESELASAEATIETLKELLAAQESSARNLMHYAQGLADHVPVSGYDVTIRNVMIEVHEDKRDMESKWEELTKAVGAHGPESCPLHGKDTNQDIHNRAMERIRDLIANGKEGA